MGTVSVLGFCVLVTFIAFIIEASIEYFIGKPMEHSEKLKAYTWALIYVGAVAGVGAAFWYHLDLVAWAATWLGLPDTATQITPVGMVLTGLGIGRGSNFIHDLMMSLIKKEPPFDIPGTPNA